MEIGFEYIKIVYKEIFGRKDKGTVWEDVRYVEVKKDLNWLIRT